MELSLLFIETISTRLSLLRSFVSRYTGPLPVAIAMDLLKRFGGGSGIGKLHPKDGSTVNDIRKMKLQSCIKKAIEGLCEKYFNGKTIGSFIGF